MVARIVWFSVLLLSLAEALLAAPGPAVVPSITLEPHRFEAGGGQSVDAEKGWLTVPESRKRPGGRTLRLTFVRFKATGEKPGPPIVYLAGGPGGSGIQAARGSRFPLFLALREFGDVIAFDQRGTGESEPPMSCAEIPARNLPLDRAVRLDEYAAAWTAQSRHCAAALRQRGIDLAAFNTEESADDLDDLRRALRAEKLTLWGISYGTHLGLATLRRHGPHIHRAILAGLEGPDDTEKPPHQQQELLVAIASLVKKDPDAGPVVPDLLDLMGGVLARLDKEPASVAVPDPRTGQSVQVVVSKHDLQLATAGLLTGPESFAALPDLYFRLAAGDWLPLAVQTVEQRTGGVQFPAMTATMDCASGATESRRRLIAREAGTTLLADAINFPFPQLCAGWDVPDLGDGFRSPLISDVPTLLISGTLDGRTPPENAEEILRGLKNGVHLVIEHAGHSDPLFLSSPKILEAMQAFLRGQPLPARRIALPTPRFPKPRSVATVSPEVLAKYVGSYRIDDAAERKVSLVGGHLFAQRTGGSPFLLRPLSETEFFYEGAASQLRFVLDAGGKVTHMVVRQADGSEQNAPKVP